MISKTSILMELASIQNIDYFEEFNEEDLLYSQSDVRPLFKFLNNDKYSAVDIDNNVLGSKSLEAILEVLTVEEDYDIRTTELLVSLVLNKELDRNEKNIVLESVKLCNYAYDFDDLQEVVDKYTKSLNGIRDYYFIPVYLSLFQMFAPSKFIHSFWNDCKLCLEECINIVHIVLNH